MTRYAIVGDGAAGATAAFYIRRADPSGEITILSDESSPAYYRAALTNYLMGELRPEQLFAVPPDFYERTQVGRIVTRVAALEPDANRLRLSDGRSHEYDQLLIAAGARARPPSFSGAEVEGVMTMRTMQDARFIMDGIASRKLRKAVVVGGGILGLELAAGLRARDVEVTYVIRGDRFMPTLLDRVASDLVVSRCRHFGVDVRMDDEIAEVEARNGRFERTRLKNSGDVVSGDLMIVAIGITPNVEFLEGSGVEVSSGIPVDDRMRTNVPDVYAAGDIAVIHDPWAGRARYLGLWEPARHQGRVAGLNMAGSDEVWRVGVPYNATRLYDLDMGGLGRTLERAGDEVVVDFPQTGASIAYRKLVFENERLVGALLVGGRKERVRDRARQFRSLIAARTDVSSVRDLLLDPMFDINAWMESLDATGRPSQRGSERSLRADLSRLVGRPAPSAPGTTPPAGRPSIEPRRDLSTLMRTPVRQAGPSVGAAAPPPDRTRPRTGPVGLPDEPLERPHVVGESLGHIAWPSGSFEITGSVARIGRDPNETQVTLEDPSVSWLHAEITLHDGALYLRDLGSRNGTFVNGELVTIPTALAHGDAIRVGTTTLTFEGSRVSGAQEERETTPNGGPLGLVGASAPVLGVSFVLSESGTTIGRAGSEIALPDPTVSRVHARVLKNEWGWSVRDESSTNGTFVNGERIQPGRDVELIENDVIALGRVELRLAPLPSGADETTPAEVPPRLDEAAAQDATRVLSAADLLGGETAPGPPSTMPVRLRVLRGPRAGETIPLHRLPLILGRLAEDDVIGLDDPFVSARHVQLAFEEGGIVVRDLDSRHGTWVDELQSHAGTATPVVAGTRLRLGPVTLLQAEG